MNKLIIDKGFCRTALTKKGFLTTMELVKTTLAEKGSKKALKKLPTAVKGIFLKSNFQENFKDNSSTCLKKNVVITFSI